MPGDLRDDAPAETLSILKQIRDGWHAALRAYGGTVDVGPFLCTFDAGTDLVWVNYATPKPDATTQAMQAAMPALRDTFSSRQRTLRFEFFDGLDPTMPALLEPSGLVAQMRMPAMVCTRAELRTATPPSGLAIEYLTAAASDERLRTFIETRDAGFGPMTQEPMAKQVSDLRRELELGAVRSAIVCVDGRPAGVGTLMGRGPVCEIGGVTTVPALRGRGVARFVSRSLAARHLADANAQAVWLTAGNDLAQRVYERIGFKVLGWQSTWIDREWLAAQPKDA